MMMTMLVVMTTPVIGDQSSSILHRRRRNDDVIRDEGKTDCTLVSFMTSRPGLADLNWADLNQ